MKTKGIRYCSSPYLKFLAELDKFCDDKEIKDNEIKDEQ